jgi:polysaccharide export outer membrane protein
MWLKAKLSRLTALLFALALTACVHRQATVVPVDQGAAVESAPIAPAVVQAPAPVAVPVAVGGPYAPALVGYDAPYQLDAGDRLRIQVFGQEGLTNSYIVDAAGNVSLSLIGTVPARGLTTTQLARAIADRLRNGYIRNPHVSVEVEVYRPFFILGEVNAPGQYPYVPNMTVEAAVAVAGGFAPRASKKDILLARNYNGEIMRARVLPDFPVRPGDTITVRERWF